MSTDDGHGRICSVNRDGPIATITNGAVTLNGDIYETKISQEISPVFYSLWTDEEVDSTKTRFIRISMA